MQLSNLISKLPDEIVQHIISYTYNLQNKALLNDIVNYNKTKKTVLNRYHKFYKPFMIYKQTIDNDWLINDMFGYANDYKATMNGFVDNFYSIISRKQLLQTRQDIDKYIIKLESKEILSQINILWGLFTPDERNEFIEISPLIIQ